MRRKRNIDAEAAAALYPEQAGDISGRTVRELDPAKHGLAAPPSADASPRRRSGHFKV